MYKADASNTVFNLAADLVNHTSRHVFITGKAGTGKTTFLKYISATTKKNVVVVAPTGVAAINAGGVTAHSFFQLPFGPFVPVSASRQHGALEATDKHSLFRNIRFSASRRELFQEMELLIIDEVSMVRCDMLDAMDTILRHFRRQPSVPFGGVQVVYIGDMFQLPPVIPQPEWELLQPHYQSPFFFEARVVQEAPPVYIELKKIYRQNEAQFIDILNRIRNNRALPADLQLLNQRYHPAFEPPPGEHYITLTTHNRKADVINEAALQKLPGRSFSFSAEITGEFSDKSLPTEQHLQLKEGAQVMFIKNDTGEARRYYNGKLGFIRRISNDEVTVAFDSGEEDLKVERETWKNIRYLYNKETDDIEEEELGSFRQFPIRLAWAITIHKSQGLTFDKAVIDAGAAFAAGQVYVALSRCTTLDGLVLHSRIWPNAIATDQRILAFAAREAADEFLEKLLVEEKEKYQAAMLVKAFGWQKIIRILREWKEMIPGKKIPAIEEVITLNNSLLQKAVQQSRIAEKFQLQLEQLLASGDLVLLEERVNKAILYFSRFLVTEILTPFREHLEQLRQGVRVKKYYAAVSSMEPVLLNYLKNLNELQYRELHFLQYSFPQAIHVKSNGAKKMKQEKGASGKESLELFRQGKSIREIAALRQLTESTVEGHLAAFIYSGEVDIHQLVAPEKSEMILKQIDQSGLYPATIKNALGDAYSFGEIRAVMNYYRQQQEAQKA